MRRRQAIGAALAGAAGWLSGCDKTPAPATARKWPAMSVRDLAGQPTLLPATTSGARLINVWALWCPPCRQELPSLKLLDNSSFVDFYYGVCLNDRIVII